MDLSRADDSRGGNVVVAAVVAGRHSVAVVTVLINKRDKSKLKNINIL